MPENSSFAPARAVGAFAAVVTGLLSVALLLLMLSTGLRHGVNHDESQHLAAGAVFGGHFLLPYRDFPYFHMPDLVFFYGALFRLCGAVVLPARIVSVTSAWLTVLLLWWVIWRECREKPLAARWLLPAAGALLLVGNPIFRDTFWRTWNHAPATFFGLAAIACAMRPARPWGWFWPGVFIGLAIGTRLTFAPLAAPLAVAAACGEPGRRVRQFVVFCAGGALSLLPSLVLFAMAPAQFLFGNFTFNSKTNVLFRQSYHDPRATLHKKLLFPFTTLLPERANLVLALLFVLFVLAAMIRLTHIPVESRRRLFIVLACIPFALIGAIAPSPSQNEYYYALLPLLVLAAALSAAAFCSRNWAWLCAILLLVPGGFVMARSWREYQHLAILKTPAAWPATQYHKAGIEIRELVPAGAVLTLEPVYPLEAGLDIYPALVTGMIAWRTEPFVPPPDRIRFQILGPDNFASALRQTAPAAVLTVSTDPFDQPLAAWAKANGFSPHLLQSRGKLVDQPTLWTPPIR